MKPYHFICFTLCKLMLGKPIGNGKTKNYWLFTFSLCNRFVNVEIKKEMKTSVIILFVRQNLVFKSTKTYILVSTRFWYQHSKTIILRNQKTYAIWSKSNLEGLNSENKKWIALSFYFKLVKIYSKIMENITIHVLFLKLYIL